MEAFFGTKTCHIVIATEKNALFVADLHLPYNSAVKIDSFLLRIVVIYDGLFSSMTGKRLAFFVFLSVYRFFFCFNQ